MEKPSQRGLAYLLLSLPLIVGLLFPTVSLDTTIVEAKGFNFPVSKESVGDPDMQTQYLKPDTSMYFNKTDYDKQMAKAMKQYDGQSVISITDENYLEIMELIYNYPSQFAGKRISYKGFVYNSKREESVDQFVFRFGIIHCVADSGVFGLLVHFPEHTQFQNNDWVTITGTVELSIIHRLNDKYQLCKWRKSKQIKHLKSICLSFLLKSWLLPYQMEATNFLLSILILLRLRRIKPKDSLFPESCGYSD